MGAPQGAEAATRVDQPAPAALALVQPPLETQASVPKGDPSILDGPHRRPCQPWWAHAASCAPAASRSGSG